MQPELAAFVSDVLFAGGYGAIKDPKAAPLPLPFPVAGRGPVPPVHFVPVPALAGVKDVSKGKGRVLSPARWAMPTLPQKGGAGYELNLADPRHRDRLAADLKGELPHTGFVNYPEAQAVVTYLEKLSADLVALDGKISSPGTERLGVGIIALYAAQAELISRLIGRMNVHDRSRLAIEVGLPSRFREREWPVVLVSLTRSHLHRAVTFGDGPDWPALALTRARFRLVILGDPGSLARRGQWEGALDHLDETVAARERDWVQQLLLYLKGQGRYPVAFQLHEGAGA
jgi:hypothetical protein